MKPNSVGLILDEQLDYPKNFNPSENFPELKNFKGKIKLSKKNDVYSSTRELFRLLELDKKNYGRANWNPLGGTIKPGDTVVLKPNAVLDMNKKRGESVFASIAHGSIIKVVVDYVFIALKGRGKIIIADAPLMHSDFKHWLKLTKVENIKILYKKIFNFDLEILDLRETYAPYSSLGYVPHKSRVVKKRDPEGYGKIDLGSKSMFCSLSESDVSRFYGADYDRQITVKNHLEGRHIYKVSGTILKADVIISIPKLKTHKKVGTTLNMKNMVGTQGDKNFIPHYKIGNPLEGGDEYPYQGFIQNSLNKYRAFLINNLLERQHQFYETLYVIGNAVRFALQKAVDFFGKMHYGEKYIGKITGGSWYGNDTAWRMTVDLIKIVLYSDKNGKIHKNKQRKFISIIDGILAGESEGPLSPTGKKCGCIFMGFDPLSVDMVATRFMGFDPLRIKLYKNANSDSSLNTYGNLRNINLISNRKHNRNIFDTKNKFLDFIPPRGWIGHIESN